MYSLIQIVVGSQNPAKIQAVESTFAGLFSQCQIHCHGVDAPSNVADQPMDEQETLEGAQNRVDFCRRNYKADYYVAIEGGVDKFSYGPATFAYVVIADSDKQSVGRSANLPIPDSVHLSLSQGAELGPLMDSLFNTHNIKQKGGAIGLLTNGVETRSSSYQQALTLAMAPFLHPQRFISSSA